MSDSEGEDGRRAGRLSVRCHESSKAVLVGPTLELIMKKYLLKTSEGLAGRIVKTAEETTGVICVALDLEVAGAAIAVSFSGKAPRYFGKSNREEILGAMKSLAGLGNRVLCVQEACGFGYRFQRELQAAGVESLVVAPEALNGRRKTDKRDAGKLCLQLIDYVLREHRDVFKVVRAPSPAQERRRAQWRQRSQLLKTRNMLAGHGRGLLQNFGHYLVAERWWGARSWPKLIAGLDPWIVEMLDSHRKIILQIEARMDQTRGEHDQQDNNSHRRACRARARRAHSRPNARRGPRLAPLQQPQPSRQLYRLLSERILQRRLSKTGLH